MRSAGLRHVSPFLARLRTKLLGHLNVADIAAEHVELAPSTVREQPASISLPAELDRVFSLQEDTTREN